MNNQQPNQPCEMCENAKIEVSNCCKAGTEVAGDETKYYICRECHKGCDLYTCSTHTQPSQPTNPNYCQKHTWEEIVCDCNLKEEPAQELTYVCKKDKRCNDLGVCTHPIDAERCKHGVLGKDCFECFPSPHTTVKRFVCPKHYFYCRCMQTKPCSNRHYADCLKECKPQSDGEEEKICTLCGDFYIGEDHYCSDGGESGVRRVELMHVNRKTNKVYVAFYSKDETKAINDEFILSEVEKQLKRVLPEGELRPVIHCKLGDIYSLMAPHFIDEPKSASLYLDCPVVPGHPENYAILKWVHDTLKNKDLEAREKVKEERERCAAIIDKRFIRCKCGRIWSSFYHKKGDFLVCDNCGSKIAYLGVRNRNNMWRKLKNEILKDQNDA